ncbi:nuclear transport factor 2 family protein [Kitasatospora sp. A2-31]|uniref:nuclear transport factor 2 family protein n=1 Tax=Kitasatospora sp. A2-31 TaxID=2916414 RepID=UPI001EEAD5F1|nr:nuclear transport factor 2 family protein [Kitasatospora sp. A2-31]MCG6495324.1 nuclear transport factor 2 family protein [Kitasatospora sp. A2-31]
MDQLDPRTVVERYVTAIADGDLPAAVACFAEHATWEYPGDLPLSRIWRGKAAIVEDFLGSAGTLFAPGGAPKVALTGLIADGPQVVAEWTARGTAANGSAYDNRCLGIFTVENGLITAVREYLDTQHAARTLFAEPAA